MGQSYFDDVEEAKGHIPALTGAKVEITGIERTKTGEKSKNPGCRMYVLDGKIKEPKKYAGTSLRGWYVVGTAEDPQAKDEATWKNQGPKSGVARLKRILVKSGTPISKDDEEWMEAAEGREIIIPVTERTGDDGVTRNGFGDLAYMESDEDCPVIGEAQAKGGAKLKAVKKAKAVVEDEDEDDAVTAKAKNVGNGNKRAAKPADDDDED